MGVGRGLDAGVPLLDSAGGMGSFARGGVGDSAFFIGCGGRGCGLSSVREMASFGNGASSMGSGLGSGCVLVSGAGSGSGVWERRSFWRDWNCLRVRWKESSAAVV